MTTRAEAERTRREAAADLRRDGARVLIAYEGEGRVDPITQVATAVPDRFVKTFALLTGYALNLVDGESIQLGDLRVMVADSELKPLGDALGEGDSTEGWSIYLAPDPSRWATVVDPLPAGTRRLRIVAVEQVVYEGGWAVLRFLRARG